MTAASNHVRQQHLISRVLLKRWATDGQLHAFDLSTGSSRLRSPRSEGFQIDFIRYGSVEAEAYWSTWENKAHTAVEAVIDGTCFEVPDHVETLKGLIGVHLFRSSQLQQMWSDSLVRQSQDPSSHMSGFFDLIRRPEVLDAMFEHYTGLEPAGPEARAMAQEQLLDDLDRRLGVGSEAFFEQLQTNLEQFLARYANAGIEIGVTSGELLIGDRPALPLDHSTHRVGLTAGVTLVEGNALILPVSPNHLVALGGDNRYRDMDDAATASVNQAQARSAVSKVYLKPVSVLIETARREHVWRIEMQESGPTGRNH